MASRKSTKQKSLRKICFVMTSFIHYSRNMLIIEELKKRKDVELHLAIGGTALLSRYVSKLASLRALLEADGFTNIHDVSFNLEGDSVVTKAKTTGLGTIEFAHLFGDIKPDVVVVRGDRFEVLSAALAATYMNIPVAHIEGGDLSGSLDESTRHAITKLSHIHFATNEDARKRIIRMGEHKKYVFNFGSPDIDVVKMISKKGSHTDLNQTGSGAFFDSKQKYLMVMYHPVNSEVNKISEQTRELLRAIHELNMQTIWFWPNVDAGSEDISHELRVFNNDVKDHKIRFMRYLPPKKFTTILLNAQCLIGNSSAGIKECSYLGIPVVNIGTRQNNRLKGKNVMTVPHKRNAIKKAVTMQVRTGRYESSDLYLGKNTSKNIATTLATIPLYIQKKFHSH